jgi:hypothetical protein
MLKEDPETNDYVVPPLEGLWWVEDMSQFAPWKGPRYG